MKQQLTQRQLAEYFKNFAAMQYYYEDLYGRNTVNANMWIQEMRRKLDDKFGETCNTFRDAFNAFAKTIE